jgi:hypothetical protein
MCDDVSCSEPAMKPRAGLSSWPVGLDEAQSPVHFELPQARGPVRLPGSQRIVWWTGRVAIGLRWQPPVHPPREREHEHIDGGA